MDYNRRRFVRSDVISNAIQKINNSISERLGLLILTAAARCVHHVSPDRRVELLEEVKSDTLKLILHIIDFPLGLENIEGEKCSINQSSLRNLSQWIE